MNIDKLITSSVDPNQVSMTVRGIITSILPIVILVTGANPEDVNNIGDGIIAVVFGASSAYAAICTVVGLARKIYLKRWTALE